MRKLLSFILALAFGLALTVLPAQSAQATTFGWRWTSTVYVYDGTGSPDWQVSSSAREWDATSGVNVVMTSDPTLAQIAVYETNTSLECGDNPGCAYYPPTRGTAAYGTCKVYLQGAFRDQLYAEAITLHELGHCFGLAHADTTRSVMYAYLDRYDFYTKPTPYDRKDMRSLYGR